MKKKKTNTLLKASGGFIRRRILPLIGAIIVFITCMLVLYNGEPVGIEGRYTDGRAMGLSDNGDFRRVLLTNNIEYIDETDKYYVFNRYYNMDLHGADNVFKAMVEAWKTNKAEDIYSSPHFLIIKISKELNVIANAVSGRPLTDYDIKYMALLYVFMLSVAALVIFTFFADNKLKLQLAVFVFYIFMFCDAGYLLYFNSFYGEPLQYTSLMLLVAFGLMIYKRPSLPKVIGFFISLYFFAGSKLANIPYSLLVALLSLGMMILSKNKRFKLGVVICSVLCSAMIAGLYFSIPAWMNRDTTYQSVFFGITKDSKTPIADLAELGVDSKYAVLANTHAYMDESEYPIDIKSEQFVKDFYDKVSKTDIVSYYLKHPVRLVRELSFAIENSAYIRPPVLGNSETIPMQLTDRFSTWSHVRVALRFLYEPWVIFMLFILITLYTVFMNVFYIHNHRIESPERKYMICSFDVLVCGLWINLLLPVLCNGEADLAKHMFLFTNCIDILFMVCLLWIVSVSIKKLLLSVTGMALFTTLFYIRLPKETITFGTYDGKPIKWQVLDSYNNGEKLIVSYDCVASMPFDSDDNSWEESDLREWLNTSFTAEFTEEELDRIVPVKNTILLPYNERDKAVTGNHAHYWNFVNHSAGDLSETAYQYYIEDRVFIPTLDIIEDISVNEAYWVLCPYTNNDYMERYVNDDSFVLHTDVKNARGVRAVMRITP